MINQTPSTESIPQEVWDNLPPESKKYINRLNGISLHVNAFLPSRKAIHLLDDLAAVSRSGFCQARLIEDGEALDTQGMIPFLSFYMRYSDFILGLAK